MWSCHHIHYSLTLLGGKDLTNQSSSLDNTDRVSWGQNGVSSILSLPHGDGDLSASRKSLTSPAKGMKWTVPVATERKTR